MYWTAAVLAVFACLRTGEIAPRTDLSAGDTERRMLRLRHLQIESLSGTVCLRIPTSKTDAAGKGATIFLAHRPALPAAVCPVKASIAFLDARKLAFADRSMHAPDAPLFATLEGKPMNRADFLATVQAWLNCSHPGLSNFSGHSFRRGGAQTLVQEGVAIENIKILGRWKSNAVFRYIDPQLPTATHAADHSTARQGVPHSSAAVAAAHRLVEETEKSVSSFAVIGKLKPKGQRSSKRRRSSIGSYEECSDVDSDGE